jgi:hypothetical protein
MRDEAANDGLQATVREDKCNALLKEMEAAGMSDWLPTLEEAQAAWRGD